VTTHVLISSLVLVVLDLYFFFFFKYNKTDIFNSHSFIDVFLFGQCWFFKITEIH